MTKLAGGGKQTPTQTVTPTTISVSETTTTTESLHLLITQTPEVFSWRIGKSIAIFIFLLFVFFWIVEKIFGRKVTKI